MRPEPRSARSPTLSPSRTGEYKRSRLPPVLFVSSRSTYVPIRQSSKYGDGRPVRLGVLNRDRTEQFARAECRTTLCRGVTAMRGEITRPG